MRPLSTFTLEIQRGDDHEPSRISVVLSTAPDADGVLRLSPQCMTLDELEGAINALQDELDVLRADARRAFTVSAGHAEPTLRASPGGSSGRRCRVADEPLLTLGSHAVALRARAATSTMP